MRRYTLMAGLAALGISLSILAFVVVLGFERDRNRQEFEIKASNRTAVLQTELALHVNTVHSLQSLYSASESVSRHDFEIFVQNELSAHPAIRALEWIPRITDDAREDFESSMQAEGFPDFRILEQWDGEALRPAMKRSEYFPVAYIEPYSGNEAALGFDLASNTFRHEALKDARDSGDSIATQRIVLVQEVEEQFGFLLFVPIYKQGASIANIEERNEALTGFTLGVFGVDDLISSAWENAGLEPLADGDTLALMDRSAPEGSRSLLSSEPELVSGVVGSGKLGFTVPLNIGGRTWEATIISPQESVFSIWQPWSALLAGLSLTTVVGACMLLGMQRESRTQLLVDQRTRQLSETNQRLENEIVDRSRIELELAGMYEISRIFAAEGDFQTKANQALEKVAVLATADWVTLRLPKPDEPGLHLAAASGPAVAEHPPIPVFTDSMTMSARAFTEGIIEVIDDYGSRPSGSNELIDLGMRSMVILPIKSSERILGLVTVISKDKNHFSPDLVHLLASVGEGLGVLLDNSLLHEETEAAHQALSEREARLRGIVESAVDGIITIDKVGTVESFNHGAEIIFGYPSTDVVGNNVKMLMPDPDREGHDSYLSAYQNTGVEKVIGSGREVMGRRKDGSEFQLDLSVSEVDLGNRKIYTGIIRDITESTTLRREVEQRAKELEVAYAELKTLDRMKDEFIATVSHELRTPLTSIKGAAEILLNYRDEDRDTQTEFLSIIDNESDRLTRLINDVLDLARLDSGESVWDISSIDLKKVIATAMDSTHALVLNKRVTIEVDSGDDIPTVEADSDKLVQVVTNLLSNAIKFTPSGGWIRVNSRLINDAHAVNGAKMVEVSVSDNGIGIAPSDVHKIFERFQQAGTTLADRPQGTGLGLAISKEIITRLGGEIWVESEPGQGSTFFFTVPSKAIAAG